MTEMTGKERILKVLNRQATDVLPWVPFAGVHAGFLAGYNAEEVYKDSDKCFESLRKVNQLYKPDGQPIIFDLQLEAEILGCELLWAKDSPPTVISHPLADTKEIPTKIPGPNEGRLPLELNVMDRMKTEFGETTALYGLITGPFTLALHLRGTNIFMDLMNDSDYVHRLLNYCSEVAVAVAGYTLDSGMDVVALVDPMISQISPAHFEEYMAAPFKRVFDYIQLRGAKSSFFVCGNATHKLDAMCRTGCDSISIDENVDLAAAKKICDKHDVVLGGNIPLTSAMLFGTQQDNMKAVVDIIDSVETKHNLIIAPGCDMPYATPVENVLAAEQAVHNTASVRNIVKNYEAPESIFTGEIPDYGKLNKPLIEVFTLDSVACAACTYMLAVVMDAKTEFGEMVDVVEHKYTDPENIGRCRLMGVKQLPSIYINGELKHSSIIPSQEELFAQIKELL